MLILRGEPILGPITDRLRKSRTPTGSEPMTLKFSDSLGQSLNCWATTAAHLPSHVECTSSHSVTKAKQFEALISLKWEIVLEIRLQLTGVQNLMLVIEKIRGPSLASAYLAKCETQRKQFSRVSLSKSQLS